MSTNFFKIGVKVCLFFFAVFALSQRALPGPNDVCGMTVFVACQVNSPKDPEVSFDSVQKAVEALELSMSTGGTSGNVAQAALLALEIEFKRDGRGDLKADWNSGSLVHFKDGQEPEGLKLVLARLIVRVLVSVPAMVDAQGFIVADFLCAVAVSASRLEEGITGTRPKNSLPQTFDLLGVDPPFPAADYGVYYFFPNSDFYDLVNRSCWTLPDGFQGYLLFGQTLAAQRAARRWWLNCMWACCSAAAGVAKRAVCGPRTSGPADEEKTKTD